MPIERAVIVPQSEFDRLPVRVGQALARRAATDFRVVNRETGEEIRPEDGLEDWFVGVLVLVWHEVLNGEPPNT